MAVEDEVVELDRLGEPVQGEGVSGLILAPGLPEASRRRLTELGGDVEVTDDLDRAAEAALVLASTRLPRAELSALVTRLRESARAPIVALTHTGGEGLSVEVMRRGGTGVVAEGNETALLAFLSDQCPEDVLLDSYDRHVARTDTGTTRSRGRDPLTGLPDRASFEIRLATLEQQGEVPRLAFVRVTRTPQVPDDLSEGAARLLRRRLASQFLHVAQAHDAELFALGGWDFGIVGLLLSPNAAQYFGRDLDRIAETYAPAGTTTLGIAMGHAGADVSTDVSALREAAQRALDAAVADRSTVVVSADTLSLGVSATTELEAALRILEFVERHGPYPAGHGARTGELAAILATELGYDGIARSRIQLAAHLHEVGLASLPPEASADPEALTGDLRAAYRHHPVAGASYLRTSAGSEVATAVRGYCERWDGTGYPDGLAGPDIPVSARIVATAHAIEVLLARGVTAPDAITSALRDQAGHALDPDVVAVAVDVLDQLLAVALSPA
jgi:HD-GYP domain-containing protein (c-di-GMP phosphodiesterase class II)